MTTTTKMEKETDMAKPNPGSNAVRITHEAMEAARIAAAFEALTVSEYVSRVVIERAKQDIEAGSRKWTDGKRPKGGKA